MQTIDLILECDEITSIEPVTRGQDYPHIKIKLDDVRVDGLMGILSNFLDPETILDHLEDRVIREYLEGRENAKR